MYPGVYCLRTMLIDLDNATLWRTCTMLTNLKSVFHRLKPDLVLRPVYHEMERQVEGHLYIMCALPFRPYLRLQLKAQGVDGAWNTLHAYWSAAPHDHAAASRGPCVACQESDPPKPHQQKIFEILGLLSNPGGTHRTVI